MSALLLASAFALLAENSVSNRMAPKRIREGTEKLSQSVDQLETAEGLAGYGRRCIEVEPRPHLWSEEMCHLAGLPLGTLPSEDILECIMPEGIAQIETELDGHVGDREPFAIEFEVAERGETSRNLRSRARNVSLAEGVREQVFMVVKEVSETYALRRACDAALRPDEKSLSVLVLDIHHFKAVNDRHCHLVGDRVITIDGETAVRRAREFDIIDRVGVEEFLWIHSALIPSITISAGHAEIEENDASLILFARADAALYEAKRGGRHRVAQAA